MHGMENMKFVKLVPRSTLSACLYHSLFLISLMVSNALIPVLNGMPLYLLNGVLSTGRFKQRPLT
jgi:hypothetical protein